jgi:hypothetical protein
MVQNEYWKEYGVHALRTIAVDTLHILYHHLYAFFFLLLLLLMLHAHAPPEDNNTKTAHSLPSVIFLASQLTDRPLDSHPDWMINRSCSIGIRTGKQKGGRDLISTVTCSVTPISTSVLRIPSYDYA